jgi:hypothetical protein
MKSGIRLWGGVIAVVATTVLSSACHFEDDLACQDCDCGDAVTRTFDLAGFDEVVVHDAFRVNVKETSTYRVAVTVSRAAEARLDVRRDGAQLTIGTRGGWGSWGGCGDRSAVVELPRLSRASADGASRIRIEGISEAPAVVLAASDASRLEGNLNVQQASIRISDASDAVVSGSAEQLDLEVSDASRASLADLATRRADVKARDASDVTLRVSDRLDVTASDASGVHYIGQPQLGRVNISGDSHLDRQR